MGGYLSGGLRMARPAKLNCDYFSHFVKHDRDLDYLIERFSIEGYYFFYTLREFLCDCDNWTYRINNDRDRAYLCKQFSIDKTRVMELMDICAENAIIDYDLWFKVQIIWQSDLAAILKDSWKGRKTPPPEKPMVEIEEKLSPRMGVSNPINPVSNDINPISNPINTQRKGKDNERIEDESKTKQIIINKNKEDDYEDRSVSSFAPTEVGQQETEQYNIEWRQLMTDTISNIELRKKSKLKGV